jgi:hypothetical protein
MPEGAGGIRVVYFGLERRALHPRKSGASMPALLAFPACPLRISVNDRGTIR